MLQIREYRTNARKRRSGNATNKTTTMWLLRMMVVLLGAALVCDHHRFAVVAVTALAVDRPPVVVAGAGPASLLFALRFLDLDPKARVEIYEKRPEPPRCCFRSSTRSGVDVPEDGERIEVGSELSSSSSSLQIHPESASSSAFGMGLGGRAQDALGKIPGLLGAVERIVQPLVGPPGSPPSWMVDRNDLCAELLHHLRHKHGDRVNLHFGCTIVNVGTTTKTTLGNGCPEAMVQHIDGEVTSIFKVPYSLLVGADGTHSAIRTALVQQGFVKGQRYLSGSTWKSLQLPSQPNLEAATTTSAPNNDNTIPPRRTQMYRTATDTGRLLPLYPDRFCLLNFRNRHQNEAQQPFGASTVSELVRAITEVLPGVTEFPSDETLRAFLDKPAGDTYYMHLNKHYVPECSTVLLGDAAVGMYNFLGQGCSYALLSANRLAEALARSEAALEVAAEANRSEGKALADLNLVVHLTKARLAKRLRGWLFARVLKLSALSAGGRSRTTEEDSNAAPPPIPTYGDVKRDNKWAIRLSRPLWMLSRTKVPLVKRQRRHW